MFHLNLLFSLVQFEIKKLYKKGTEISAIYYLIVQSATLIFETFWGIVLQFQPLLCPPFVKLPPQFYQTQQYLI